MTSLGFLKSIILYQSSLDPNVVKGRELLEAIDNSYFDPIFFQNAESFFNNVLKTRSFKDISKNDMILFEKIIQNTNTTIDSFFYTKPSLFLEEEIQNFYSISSLLLNKVRNVINNLNVENISISSVENQILVDIQEQYREYIQRVFFRKYIENSVNPGSSNGMSSSSGNSSGSFLEKKEYIKWNVEIIYNKKKKPHYEYMFRQFYNSKVMNTPKKLGILYFMKNIEYLPKLETYPWTHNMVVREYDAKYDYAIRGKSSLYNIRYDINNVREEDVKRIFIYGYSITNGIKIFVGFAYYTTEHFRQVSPQYLSIFSVW